MKQYYITKRNYGALYTFIGSLLALILLTYIYINDKIAFFNDLSNLSKPYLNHPDYNTKLTEIGNSIQYKYMSYEDFQFSLIFMIIVVAICTYHYSYKSKYIIFNILANVLSGGIGIYYLTSYADPEYNKYYFFILLPFLLLIWDNVIIGRKINISDEVYLNTDKNISSKKSNLKELFTAKIITSSEFELKMKQLIREELNAKGFNKDKIDLLNKSLENGI